MGFTKLDNDILEAWIDSGHLNVAGCILLLTLRGSEGWHLPEWAGTVAGIAKRLEVSERAVQIAIRDLEGKPRRGKEEGRSQLLKTSNNPGAPGLLFTLTEPGTDRTFFRAEDMSPRKKVRVGPEQKIGEDPKKSSDPTSYRKKEKENLKKTYVQGSERGGSSAHAREAEPSDPLHTKGGQGDTGTPPPSEHPEESATTTGGLDDPGGRQAPDGPAGTDGGGGDDLSLSSDGGESWPEGWPRPGTNQAPGAERWEATRLLSYWHSYAQELLGPREEDELALAEHITTWWPGGWLMEICGYAAGAVPQGRRYARLKAMLERQAGTGPGG